MAASGQPIPEALITKFLSASWIWTPETNLIHPPVGTRAFRQTYTPPTGKIATEALVLLTVDNFFTLYINGQHVGSPPSQNEIWKNAQIFNVALKPGPIVFAVSAINLPDIDVNGVEVGAAGVLAAIQIKLSDGTTAFISSDASWRSIQDVPANFASPSIDESPWGASAAINTYGVGAWGTFVSLPSGGIPSLLDLSNLPTPTSFNTNQPSGVIISPTSSKDSSQNTLTNSPSPTTSSTSVPSISSNKQVNPAAIGGAIGGAAILILLFGFFFLRRRRHRQRSLRTEKATIDDESHPLSSSRGVVPFTYTHPSNAGSKAQLPTEPNSPAAGVSVHKQRGADDSHKRAGADGSSGNSNGNTYPPEPHSLLPHVDGRLFVNDLVPQVREEIPPSYDSLALSPNR